MREATLRRRLDQELVRRGLASGRDEAKRLIEAGVVSVDGSSLVKAATMVSDGSSIGVARPPDQWASRAGEKLAWALDVFSIDPDGSVALDVGASTGGFTDVLLTRGATRVTALDVGYGQLVWRLRSDERVTVLDRTNFRTVDLAVLAPPFDIVVMDVSFISVRLLAERLSSVGRDGTDYVVLVKPQFEVGRENVGRGGIVTDPTHHVEAIRSVHAALLEHGIGPIGLTTSPITGTKGNREFLLHGRKGHAVSVSDTDILEVVA